MKDLFKIFKLIYKVLSNPKKVIRSNDLEKYKMGVMNYFIALVTFFLWGVLAYLKFDLNSTIYTKVIFIISISLIISVLSLILKKIVIFTYSLIIKIVFRIEISFADLEKIITPYYALLVIMVSLIEILQFYLTFLLRPGLIIFIVWLNLQIYYLITLKILPGSKRENSDILKKVIVVIIIIILLRISFVFLFDENILNDIKQKPKLNYQNPIIRNEVYQDCKDIYNEIQETMQNGKGISVRQLDKITSKTFEIVLYRKDPLRGNELKLIRTVEKMAEFSHKLYTINNGWHEIKSQEKIDETVKEILTKYNNLVNDFKNLIKNYYEGNNEL